MEKKTSDEIFEKVSKKMKKSKRLLILSIISIILTILFLITYILYLPIFIDVSNYEKIEDVEMNSGKYDGSHRNVEYIFEDEMFDYVRKYYDSNNNEIKINSDVYKKDLKLIKMSPYIRIIDKFIERKDNINNHKITLQLPLKIETEIVQGHFSLFIFENPIQIFSFIGLIIFLFLSIIILIIFNKNKKFINRK